MLAILAIGSKEKWSGWAWEREHKDKEEIGRMLDREEKQVQGEQGRARGWAGQGQGAGQQWQGVESASLPLLVGDAQPGSGSTWRPSARAGRCRSREQVSSDRVQSAHHCRCWPWPRSSDRPS